MAKQLLRNAATQLASKVDRAFVDALITPSARTRRRDPAESLSVAERLPRLNLMQAFYGQPDFKNAGAPFFTRLAEIRPKVQLVRRLGRTGEVVDLSWESGFRPLWSPDRVSESLLTLRSLDALSTAECYTMLRLLREVESPQSRAADLALRYLNRAQNQTAHARWFRHRQGPRPAVMLIHGHMGGFMPMEERLWPTMKLFKGGMDVLFMTLPLHGRRRDPKRGLRPPDFPASDPRGTIEAFRHLAHDYLSLADHLLGGGLVSSIGLGGMSLGGYAAALLATLDPRFSFALMLVPLACIADFALTNGRLIGSPEEQALQAQGLRDAQAVISPLRVNRNCQGIRCWCSTAAPTR